MKILIVGYKGREKALAGEKKKNSKKKKKSFLHSKTRPAPLLDKKNKK